MKFIKALPTTPTGVIVEHRDNELLVVCVWNGIVGDQISFDAHNTSLVERTVKCIKAGKFFATDFDDKEWFDSEVESGGLDASDAFAVKLMEHTDGSHCVITSSQMAANRLNADLAAIGF